MKIHFFIIFSIALLLQSCNDKNSEKSKQAIEENNPVSSIDTIKIKKELDWDVSTITRIDSTEFFEAKREAQFKNKTYIAISDFSTAKEMLKGVVFFGNWENVSGVKNDTGQGIIEIIPRKTNQIKRGEFETYFVAYYPELDILLCEGGHTIDISYNLTTGEATEDTGNPEFMVTSSDDSIRLNGFFDGQECNSWFIQQKRSGHFKKIINLSDIFNRRIGQFSLCTIGDSFWQDNTTLYIEETDNYEGKNRSSFFYIVKLMKKPY